MGDDVMGGRLITGFSGTRAIRPDDRDAVEREIRMYFPDAMISAADGHDWVADPYSKGTWFGEKPGCTTEIPQLAEGSKAGSRSPGPTSAARGPGGSRARSERVTMLRPT